LVTHVLDLEKQARLSWKGTYIVSFRTACKAHLLLMSFQHCYVTGGSSGLGLALSEYLARQGAHVTIVARDTKKLVEAQAQIKASSPLLLSYSCAYTTHVVDTQEIRIATDCRYFRRLDIASYITRSLPGRNQAAKWSSAR
jgi:hypothetical protein